MSYTVLQLSWSISFSDDSGTPTTMRGWLPLDTDETTALAKLESLVGAVAPLTRCGIPKYAITYRVIDESIPNPRSNTPIPLLARLVFALDLDPVAYTSVLIPLNPDWVSTEPGSDGAVIDTANADIISLASELAENNYCDVFGADIVSIVSGLVEAST